jgi:ribosomal protein S3AE
LNLHCLATVHLATVHLATVHLATAHLATAQSSSASRRTSQLLQKKNSQTLFSQWRRDFLTGSIHRDIYHLFAAINPCSAADLTITCRLILTGNGGHLLSP